MADKLKNCDLKQLLLQYLHLLAGVAISPMCFSITKPNKNAGQA
jgi:hypothetical protein